MIENFKEKWLENFFVKDKSSRKIPANLKARLFRKLELINFATCDLDLRSPPCNHFEKLSGNLHGYCSIRLNKQWRIIFQWDGSSGTAIDLYLDNHSYR